MITAPLGIYSAVIIYLFIYSVVCERFVLFPVSIANNGSINIFVHTY